ncbi:hypothetical protein MJO10_31470, partial [Salmonella enterica subsp. enterica serovar Anatum]|nr:hypothetical protein [Salmonella enterica subsp. enterica serovar Anatum]
LLLATSFAWAAPATTGIDQYELKSFIADFTHFKPGDTVPQMYLPNKIGLDLWFLLYDFYELDGDERVGIRAELSRPISYNSKNVV